MSRKKASVSEPKMTPAAQCSAENNARPARECLKPRVLEELWSIWRADPRMPSLKSRRAWATSRDAKPRLVDGWFLRRKACAKKAGKPVPDEPYELSLGLPKRERSATPIKAEADLGGLPDLPSDDSVASLPDNDIIKYMEASSDTICDAEEGLVELERAKIPAYMEVLCYRCLQPDLSFTCICAADHDGKTTSSEDSSFVLDQSKANPSGLTLALCIAESAQDEDLPDSVSMFDSDGVPCSRLDFLPDTLSELSAIPFLFRTPVAVCSDKACIQSVDDWSTVEDELGRLVNDGTLDFSFLNVPHLISMELL